MTASPNAPAEQHDAQATEGPAVIGNNDDRRRKGIKTPAAMYTLPFILTLTNLHVQATTAATATATRTLETSTALATPTPSAATTILLLKSDQ